MREKLQEMQTDQKSISEELRELKERQVQFDIKSEDRHQEMLRTIHSLKADQDYIWQKAVRNEREIDRLETIMSPVLTIFCLIIN